MGGARSRAASLRLKVLTVVGLLVVSQLHAAAGHGYLSQPVSRNWRNRINGVSAHADLSLSLQARCALRPVNSAAAVLPPPPQPTHTHPFSNALFSLAR